jgi:hypothetical protein
MPETYAPPVQRQPFENFRPYRASRLINMGDGDTDSRIVRDISHHADGTWRWTGQRPTVRLPEGSNKDVRYVIDFTVPRATFSQTGPVTLSFYVNGHVLDRIQYTSPGQQHFERAVPSDWLEDGKEAIVGAEIDKMYVAKDDDVRLGFILSAIGFKRE